MASHRLGDYIDWFFRQSYPALFDSEVQRRLENVRAAFGERETEEVILEVHLSDDSRRCDYSFRGDTDRELVKNYWLELDYEACATQDISPCYFIDASALKPGVDASAFYETALPGLAGVERAHALRYQVEQCVEYLNGRCRELFQLGAMSGRGQDDSLRVFPEDMKREDALGYLADLNWPGDLAALDAFLSKCQTEGGCGLLHTDFDLFADRISHKIGINIMLSNAPEVVRRWLDFLEREGLCLAEKKEDVLRFLTADPNYEPFIQNDIAHFKIPFENGKPLGAKAYLRHNGVPVKEFRTFYAPVQMNLELTSRCPLRCPQCYCDLNKGKDLPLDKALYWLENAAKHGVSQINLSGGETMCYPHLHQLIEFCRDHGLQSNVALSGWGIDEKSLQRLMDCGVNNIYISLNGSTDAINQKSRDGYALAIRALELLQKKAFANTYINWVMHSFNADDFPAMLELAERYGVSELVVLVFKPNADHELPSLPTGEQVREIAKTIRAYQGPVKVTVEGCFSQLRAVLNQRFFTNLNRGVSRGCGAGRDGISVSADGKLTPCRHLEIEEDWDDILAYWQGSETLKKLRAMEDEPQSPCNSCKYQRYCLPCAAVNYKQKGSIFMGCSCCPICPEPKEGA